jgi:hypothetical protein
MESRIPHFFNEVSNEIPLSSGCQLTLSSRKICWMSGLE